MKAEAIGTVCSCCGRVAPSPHGRCCGKPTHSVYDWYKLLDIPRDSDSAAITRAFRKQALVWHPDRCASGEAREMFMLVADAYQTLRDSGRREEYDHVLRALETGDLHAALDEAFLKREEAIRETSTRWAEGSLSALESSLSVIDGVFRGLSDISERLFKARPWKNEALRRRARLAAIAYSLVGIWFLIGGAVLFPFLVKRQLRNRPEREEALLGLLGVLLLVLLLGYLVVVEKVPLAFHAVFWIAQCGSLVSVFIWRRRFRATPHLPDTV